MIGNPVVAQQGGGSKVYSITDNVEMGFPASAEAGDWVTTLFQFSIAGLSITDSKGNKIPYSTVQRTYSFVMPSSDVTITAEP